MNYIRARIGALIVGILFVLTACGVSTSTSRDDTALTNNPRMGPVFVRTLSVDGTTMSTIKFCDGTTLVYNYMGYNKGGGSTIPNSPECVAE